jgi:hypothetical protein
MNVRNVTATRMDVALMSYWNVYKEKTTCFGLLCALFLKYINLWTDYGISLLNRENVINRNKQKFIFGGEFFVLLAG